MGGTRLDLVLSLVITSLSAVLAVVLAIFSESEGVVGLAQCTVFLALAEVLLFVADNTLKYLVGHMTKASLSRIQSLPAYFAALDAQNQTVSACCENLPVVS